MSDDDDGGGGGRGGFGRASFVSVLDTGAERRERAAARSAILDAEEKRYLERQARQKRRDESGEVCAHRAPPPPRRAQVLSTAAGSYAGPDAVRHTGDVDGARAGTATRWRSAPRWRRRREEAQEAQKAQKVQVQGTQAPCLSPRAARMCGALTRTRSGVVHATAPLACTANEKTKSEEHGHGASSSSSDSEDDTAPTGFQWVEKVSCAQCAGAAGSPAAGLTSRPSRSTQGNHAP